MYDQRTSDVPVHRYETAAYKLLERARDALRGVPDISDYTEDGTALLYDIDVYLAQQAVQAAR